MPENGCIASDPYYQVYVPFVCVLVWFPRSVCLPVCIHYLVYLVTDHVTNLSLNVTEYQIQQMYGFASRQDDLPGDGRSLLRGSHEGLFRFVVP